MVPAAQDSSVTRDIQFYLSAEDPRDAVRVGQDHGNAHAGNVEHNSQRFLGGGGIDNVEAVGGLGIAENEIGIHVHPKESHEEDHRKTGGEKRAELATQVDFTWNVGDGQDIQEGDGKNPGFAFNGSTIRGM